MKNILVIECSPNGNASFSRKLVKNILKKLDSKYPDSKVVQIDLVKNPPPFLTGEQIHSAFTPSDTRSEEQDKCLARSTQYIEQILSADIIIIGFPVWNFMIPAQLKAWIDQIVRVHMTFCYSDTGAEGLVKDKKVYLAFSRGGLYPDKFENDPSQKYDFSEYYMKTVLSYIGITDVSVFKVEGTAIPGVKENAYEKAIAHIKV